VAELVDALASGASGLTAVKVRVLSWAPLLFQAEVHALHLPLTEGPLRSPMVGARGHDHLVLFTHQRLVMAQIFFRHPRRGKSSLENPSSTNSSINHDTIRSVPP
jgi:hypothetical protein